MALTSQRLAQGCSQTQALLGRSGRHLSESMARYVQGHTFQATLLGKAEQKGIPSAFLTADLLSPSAVWLRLIPAIEHLSLEARRGSARGQGSRTRVPGEVAPAPAGVTGSLVQEQGWGDPLFWEGSHTLQGPVLNGGARAGEGTRPPS